MLDPGQKTTLSWRLVHTNQRNEMQVHKLTIIVPDSQWLGAAGLAFDIQRAQLTSGYGSVQVIHSESVNVPCTETCGEPSLEDMKKAFAGREPARVIPEKPPAPVWKATAVEAISLLLEDGQRAILVPSGDPWNGLQCFSCLYPADLAGCQAVACLDPQENPLTRVRTEFLSGDSEPFAIVRADLPLMDRLKT